MTRPTGDAAPVPAAFRVDDTLSIPLSEFSWRFDPSGGPGGQHANKVSSRVELRWDVATSAALSESQQTRLIDKLGKVVRVSVDDARSQTRNRSIALDRLAERITVALRREAPRRPTRPTKASQRRRLEAKKQRSQIKQGRGRINPGE